MKEYIDILEKNGYIKQIYGYEKKSTNLVHRVILYEEHNKVRFYGFYDLVDDDDNAYNTGIISVTPNEFEIFINVLTIDTNKFIEKEIKYTAYSTTVWEYEAGWGEKPDDCVIALTEDDIKSWINEFNSFNNKKTTPEWYMVAEVNYTLTTVNKKQMEYLQKNKTAWLKELNKLNNNE